jgi:hypothetical protein
MESTEQEDWGAAREHYRAVLYGYEDDGTPDAIARPLAELALQTTYKSLYNKEEKAVQTAIRDNVAAVMSQHDRAARGVDTAQQALFGTATPEALTFLTEYTGEVVWRWDWACKKQGQQSPFADLYTGSDPISLENDAARLVVETASAVAETASHGYLPEKMSGQTITDFIRLILRRSPAYMAAWAQGRLLDEPGQQQNENTPGGFSLARAELAKVAFLYSQDPLKRYAEIRDHFTNTLSPENIKRIVGDDGLAVAQALSPSHRKELARKYKRPDLEVQRIATALSTIMSTDALTERYGISPEDADRHFTTSVRVRAWFKNPRNPLVRLDKTMHHIRHTITPEAIAATLGWDVAEVERTFDLNLLTNRACNHPNTLTAIIKRTAKNKDYLNSAFLAKQLGYTEDKIDDMFTYTARRALIEKENPLAAAREIARVTQALQEYSLPQGVVRKLASRLSADRAIETAKLIKEQQMNCPRGIGPDVWASAWATYPKPADDAKRRKQVMSFYELRAVVLTLPYNNAIDGDESLAPHTALEATMPSDTLETFADMAGIGYDQLQQLLSHFQHDTHPPEDGALSDAFAKLQAALKTTGANAQA